MTVHRSPLSLWRLLGAALGWMAAWGFAAAAVARVAGHDWPWPPVALLALPGMLGPLLVTGWFVRRHWSLAARAAFWRNVADPRGITWGGWIAIVAVGAGPTVSGFLYGLAAGEVPATLEITAPGAIAFMLGFALLAGFVEEPLWRGVARDAAQAIMHPLAAAAIVGIAWAAWHTPLFLIPGTYQAAIEAWSLPFFLYFCRTAVHALLLAWLVNALDGRVFTAVVAHALINIAGESLPATDVTEVVEFLVVLAGATGIAAGTRGRLACRPLSDQPPP